MRLLRNGSTMRSMVGTTTSGTCWVLAGDIGGTKSLLAVFRIADHTIETVCEERYESRAYPGLVEMVEHFHQRIEEPIASACFAIAGPVVGDTFSGPNLAWSIQITRLSDAIGIPRTAVINDFTAIGHGLERLTEADFCVLQPGEIRKRGVIGLIGAGTGLGEGYLTWHGGRYRVHASEGGHCDFAPADARQAGLLEYLRNRYGHVSYERIVSGPGLVDTFHYLIESGTAPDNERVRHEMATEDPAAVISRHALAEDDPASVLALDLFVSVFGAEAGNLALKLLTTAGIYIAGGIAPKIVEKLRDGTFLQAFCRKGRHAELLSTIPVSVIRNPRVGLIGAGCVAYDLLR